MLKLKNLQKQKKDKKVQQMNKVELKKLVDGSKAGGKSSIPFFVG